MSFALIFPEGFGICLGATLAVVRFELQFLALDADRGTGRDGAGDEGVGANDRISADDRFTAEDRRTGVNGHVVFNGGVALHTAQALAAPGGQTTEGDTLINFHMLANDGGFTDDDAGTVINEEVTANGGAGMDIDAGDAVGMLGHDAG